MTTTTLTQLDKARADGYLTHASGRSHMRDDAVWFDECERDDKPYAYAVGAQFRVDLIGQSYYTRWTLDRIQTLFDELESLCGRQFSLFCGGVIVRVKGIAPGNVPDVARLVLAAINAYRVPRGEAGGYGFAFTRANSPAKYAAQFGTSS